MDEWKGDADEDEFWSLVGLARTDQDAFRGKLEALDRRALLRFAWMFEERVRELSGEPHLRHMPANFSEDSIDDLGTWVVGQGRAYYDEVMANPDRLPTNVDFQDPAMFMRYTASQVYRSRFGGTLPPYGDDY